MLHPSLFYFIKRFVFTPEAQAETNPANLPPHVLFLNKHNLNLGAFSDVAGIKG
jgi:hypothetical protein